MATTKEIVRTAIERAESKQAFIKSVSAKKASTQLTVIQAMEELAIDNGRYPGGRPALADTIVHQFGFKVEQYGERAYPLSERQIAIVVNELWRWIVSPSALEQSILAEFDN